MNRFKPFQRFVEDGLVWEDGHEEKIDVVIFCTGFRASLNHLKSLNIINPEGRIDTDGTKAKNMSGLWLVGYGNWTGFASATFVGVGRSAKKTVDEIQILPTLCWVVSVITKLICIPYIHVKFSALGISEFCRVSWYL